MFCTKCGKEILEKDFFCSNCENKIKEQLLDLQQDGAVNSSFVSNATNNTTTNVEKYEIEEKKISKEKGGSKKSPTSLSDMHIGEVEQPIAHELNESLIEEKSRWWLAVNFMNACILHFFINTFASEREVILGGFPTIAIILLGYGISMAITNIIQKKIKNKFTLIFIGFLMPVVLFFAVISLLVFFANT